MNHHECWICNGRVIDPANQLEGAFDICIRDGKIAGLHPAGQGSKNGAMIDASGKVVTPGLIDIHVHFRDPGYEYKEDIESGTRAAAAGGFTSVACMANTNPVNDSASVTRYIINRAREVGLVNLFPIGAVTKALAGRELADIGDMKQAGAVALSDDGNVIDSARVLRRAMEYASSFGLPIISHCEENSLVKGGVMNEGRQSTLMGVRGRPVAAEDITIFRDIELSRLTGCRLHVAHLTSQRGAELIRQAKREGLPVTTEVTPHHLLLTESACEGYNVAAKMNPPLRLESDREALLQALIDGTIDAIATDHAPHGLIDKEIGFDHACCGVVGIETAFSVCHQLVVDGKLSLTRLIELFTTGPAGVLNLPKGTLSIGADADITIIDPSATYHINERDFYSKGYGCPFHGWDATGRIAMTLVGGKVVYPFT